MGLWRMRAKNECQIQCQTRTTSPLPYQPLRITFKGWLYKEAENFRTFADLFLPGTALRASKLHVLPLQLRI